MTPEIPFPLPDQELGKILSRLLTILADANTSLPLSDKQVKYIIKGLDATHGHGTTI